MSSFLTGLGSIALMLLGNLVFIACLFLFYNKRVESWREGFVLALWPTNDLSRCKFSRGVIRVCGSLAVLLLFAVGIFFVSQALALIESVSGHKSGSWPGYMWMLMQFIGIVLAFAPVVPVIIALEKAIDFTNTSLLREESDIRSRNAFGNFDTHDEGEKTPK